MSKDPAFLFYSSDFLTDTLFMTDTQVGKYIRLWCAQRQHGHLPRAHMLNICKRYDKDIFDKYDQDGQGLFFNPVLEELIIQRRRYCESRRNNRLGAKNNKTSGTCVPRMENEAGNENTLRASNDQFIKGVGGIQ